jgi:hypothetical protein
MRLTPGQFAKQPSLLHRTLAYKFNIFVGLVPITLSNE